MTVSSSHETPVTFPVDGAELVGIFTRPAGAANGLAVVSLWGGGGVPAFGKNQARTRLSRELAARGFHVLRFSYPGVAESGGTLRDAFQKPAAEDAIGAVRWLTSQGFQHIILIGLCAGGRAALAAADRIDGLTGLALISSPVGEGGHRDAVLEQPVSWYVKRAASPRSLLLLASNGGKAKRRRKILRLKLRRMLLGSSGQRPPGAGPGQVFLPQVRAVLDAGTRMLFLYGRADDFHAGFEQALHGPLGRMIAEKPELAAVQVVDERFDGLASVSAQEVFLRAVISWSSDVADARAESTRAADASGRGPLPSLRGS